MPFGVMSVLGNFQMTCGRELQKAQLPQRDRATRYVDKFVLFHELWEL